MIDDYREVDIRLVRMARPYREQLEAQTERLAKQIDALEEQLDEVYDKARDTSGA